MPSLDYDPENSHGLNSAKAWRRISASSHVLTGLRDYLVRRHLLLGPRRPMVPQGQLVTGRVEEKRWPMLVMEAWKFSQEPKTLKTGMNVLGGKGQGVFLH